MKTSDYYFDLPEELIAQYPADRRGTSRLLILDKTTGSCRHTHIDAIVDEIPDDAVVVVNNSKVRKARVFAETEFSGKVEFLFLEALDKFRWKVMVTKAKRQKVGRTYRFDNDMSAVLVEDHGGTKVIETDIELTDDFFDAYGHVPLPPYIKREDDFSDASRYQTVYAEKPGSVAAPTAGLHFTKEIMDSLERRGIVVVPVTLHVGLGTFLPIRTDDIHDHVMHTEQYEISEESAALLNEQLDSNRPIVAVGTTSVRTLESAFDIESGHIVPGKRSTDIFIRPGYTFKVVDMLLTNFHTPESTLLILVSAFAGKEKIFSAYREAIDQKYRFFSYGDAMFIK